MAKANQFFTQRGKVTKKIEYNDEEIEITLHVPTNFEHDQLMEEFTEVTEFGTNVKASEMIEARMIRNIIDLPFEVPKTEDVNGEYVNWADATQGEKQCAIRSMDQKLRELINTKLVGETEISEDEQGKSA
jgi:hypothetical protein